MFHKRMFHENMCREKCTGRFSAAVFVVAVFSCAACAQANAPKPTVDLPAGTMQAKTTTACTECHEARIIVQQRLSKAAWTKEVDKMVKWGALVDANDRDALIDYLSGNFSPDKPGYEPPRSASRAAAHSKQ
jgi:hypothetical protein